MATITRRGETFRIVVSLGYDMDGKQIRKSTTFTPPDDVTASKAKKFAENFAFEFERKCKGATNLNENMRFSELADWYFENIAPNTLKENTLYGSKKSIHSYVVPAIGNLKLKDISTGRFDILFNYLKDFGAVRDCYSLIKKKAIPFGLCPKISERTKISPGTIYRLNNGGRVFKGKAEKIAKFFDKDLKELFCVSKVKNGLSPPTIKRLAALISSIFSVALRKGIVTKNPVTNSTTPKVEQIRKPFFDETQCKQLLKVLKTHQNKQFQVAIKVLLHTGLRSGELLGLRRPDISFEYENRKKVAQKRCQHEIEASGFQR
jgi:integrase